MKIGYLNVNILTMNANEKGATKDIKLMWQKIVRVGLTLGRMVRKVSRKR